MAERLNRAIQENLITMLAYDDVNGKLVAELVDANLFEGEMRVIGERCIDFWKRHGEAPKLHTGDLFAEIYEDPGNRKSATYKRLLTNMMELSEGLNTAYVLNQLQTFDRMQRMKDAILKSAERLNSKQEMAIEEVEEIWNGLLRTRAVTYDPGMRLQDYDRMLNYMSQQQSEFLSGIPELDRHGIRPNRCTLTMFLASTGRGKSWYLVNIGKQALLNRKKVLHISLEMAEEEVALRYYQAMFVVPKFTAEVELLRMKRDKTGTLAGFHRHTVTPEFGFDSKLIRDELETRITYFDAKMNNLLIKRFPTRALTMPMLKAYIDNLEVTEQFIPDMICLDYLGLMKTDPNNHRLSLGHNSEEFRGFCVDHDIAGVTAHQVNRLGSESKDIKMSHISEDWSLTNTADTVLTMTSTDSEKQLGLARVYVGKARTAEQDAFAVLITQKYRIGQFCLDSIRLNERYQDYLREMSGNEKADDDGDETID